MVVHLLRVQNLPPVVVIVFVKQVYFDFANQGAKLKNIIDCHHLSPWLSTLLLLQITIIIFEPQWKVSHRAPLHQPALHQYVFAIAHT